MGPKQLYVKWQLPSRQHHKPWVSFNPGLSWLQQTVAWAVRVVPLSTHPLSLPLFRVFLCLQSTHQIPSSLRPLIQDFPGGPVVKTVLPLQGHGFNPLSGKFHMLHSEKKKKTHKTYSSISSFHLLRLLSEVFGHQLIRRAPSPPLKLLWVLFFHLLPLLLSFVTSILLWSYSILFLPLSLSFHHLNPLDTFWFLLR